MFGLKPPLYYLPGKRAVRLPGSRAAPAGPGPPPPPDPPPVSPRPGSARRVRRAPRGLARAARVAPAAVQPAVCVLRAAGSAHPPAAPTAPLPAVLRLAPFVCLPVAGSAAAAARRAAGALKSSEVN